MPTIFEQPALPIAGKRYIYGQIMDWILVKKEFRFARMTNVPKEVQFKLEQEYSLNTLSADRIQEDRDGTKKFLFTLHRSDPDVKIESVFIPSCRHSTACLSTQAGCACGCVFCATGRMGPGRNLHFSEIVLQLLNMAKEVDASISHIVLMGMGEPLHNYDQVVRAIRFFEESALRVSARRITLSTVGLPDRIRRLTDEGVRVELALSLHSADENKRRRLIPYHRLSSLDELMDACDYYYGKTKRLPTFEYVVIKGVNDGQSDIADLVKLLRRRPGKINLIAMNGRYERYESPSQAVVRGFCDALVQQGIKATVRRSAGKNIDAACGQLKAI